MTIYSSCFTTLPIIVISLSNVTAKRLRSSVREISPRCVSSTQLLVRNRSAAVVTALAWLFVLTQVPFHTWAAVCYWMMPDRNKLYILIPEYVTKYMLFLNSCLNPAAVYLASGAFRKFFKECVRAQQPLFTQMEGFGS
ncbi:hypothetical protein C0J52_21393 [Blattella germanica]|nr:hypothetical protein C0J52_21393 [Blattella germanica]